MASDQAILDALRGGRYIKARGVKQWHPYQLYAAASYANPREPDWQQWYLTYSRSRVCPQGPISLEQVQRLIKTGRLEPDFVDHRGHIQVWVLRGNSTLPTDPRQE